MKRLFIFLFIGVTLLMIVGTKINRIPPELQKPLRLSIPAPDPMSFFDPANIQTIDQASIVGELYSNLVYFDESGKLTGDLAETYYLEGQNLIFEIRPGKVTAEDIVYSFKRLFIKNTNTHGNVQLFLKDCPLIQNVEGFCPSLFSNGNRVQFVLKNKNNVDLLIPMLASNDFGVVPKDSIDWSKPDLPIINYKKTSGPYRLKKESEDGHHVLEVNPDHPFHSLPIAPEVELVPTGIFTKEPQFFEKNKIDFVGTFDTAAAHDLILTADKNEDVTLYASQPIQIYTIFFSLDAISKLSTQDRLKIGKLVKGAYLSIYSEERMLSPAVDYFSVVGDGGLNDSQVKEIQNMWSEVTNDSSPPPSSKGTIMFNNEQISEIVGRYSQGKIDLFRYIDDLREKYGESAQADFRLVGIDAGFFENVSMMSYLFSQNFFGMNRESGEAWIKKYIAQPTKDDRMRILRKLHFDVLKNAYVVPVARAPYYAIARKPWKMNFPKIFAGSQLWMLTYK